MQISAGEAVSYTNPVMVSDPKTFGSGFPSSCSLDPDSLTGFVYQAGGGPIIRTKLTETSAAFRAVAAQAERVRVEGLTSPISPQSPPTLAKARVASHANPAPRIRNNL